MRTAPIDLPSRRPVFTCQRPSSTSVQRRGIEPLVPKRPGYGRVGRHCPVRCIPQNDDGPLGVSAGGPSPRQSLWVAGYIALSSARRGSQPQHATENACIGRLRPFGVSAARRICHDCSTRLMAECACRRSQRSSQGEIVLAARAALCELRYASADRPRRRAGRRPGRSRVRRRGWRRRPGYRSSTSHLSTSVRSSSTSRTKRLGRTMIRCASRCCSSHPGVTRQR